MRITKKIVALILALLMVFSLAATASAAEPGSITIQNTVSGKTYNLYKIFDLTYSGSGDDLKVAYTIAAGWEAFFSGSGAGYIVDSSDAANPLSPITVNGEAKYINITEANIAAFADAALAYAAAKPALITETAEGDGSNVTVTGLPLGYYLVYPQGATDVKDSYASICSLTSTVPHADVVIKAEYPSLTKTATETSVDVGQIVEYELTGKVPDTTGYTTYTYEITDTMTEGLTYQKNAVVTVDTMASALVKDTHYTITETDSGFVLTIKVMDLQAYAGKTITVKYTAQVNEKAVVVNEETGAIDAESNKASLTYSNDPSDSTSKEKTPDVEKKVYTSKIVIKKVDADDNTKLLEGAEFVLLNSESKYYNLTDGVVTWVDDQDDATVVTTDKNGAAEFKGLANGTYELKETKAPAGGYNLLTETKTVIVQGSDTTFTGVVVSATVENSSGWLTPGTGSIGTTIFYVVGGLMLFAAVVLLITKKRMVNAE